MEQGRGDIKYPTKHQLWNKGTGVTCYRIGDSEIFVNFNRRLQPFIRVVTYPSGRTKTFAFTRQGYHKAIGYLKSEVLKNGSKGY